MLKSGGKWLPVAYDFDFAAFVNAPYVHTKVKDNKTLRRTYLGFRENESYLPEVIELFESKKDEIETFIKITDLISSGERKDCLKYVRDFYREISTKPVQLHYKD
ncbi:MAG: hypothetical protein IPL46_20375 [Saprospiraceae bacterium]|nr:hypothetical protein [Saprospiraceae bacterium]